MTDPYSWIDNQLDSLRKRSQYRSLQIRQSPHVGGKVQIDGEQLIDFGSNDYLGLSSDARLVDAIKTQTGYLGWGSGASPSIHGRGALHAQLESELAQFEGTESALLFPTGYAANVGSISALVGSGDTIFSDEENHASIIDGCRLSRADVKIYRHNDLDHLRECIGATSSTGRKLVVTDSLFSMKGDLAKLPELAQICDQHGFMLLVDEAHATGVLGANGQGVAEHLGVNSSQLIKVGTLSKAIGCHGGFVAGKQKVIDWLVNQSRTYIFSTAFPEANCAAAIMALKIVTTDNSPRIQLLQQAESLRELLKPIGLVPEESSSQIIPLILSDSDLTLTVQQKLREKGFYVPGIRPPSVKPGESLLRISLNSTHNEEMIEGLVSAISNSV